MLRCGCQRKEAHKEITWQAYLNDKSSTPPPLFFFKLLRYAN